MLNVFGAKTTKCFKSDILLKEANIFGSEVKAIKFEV